MIVMQTMKETLEAKKTEHDRLTQRYLDNGRKWRSGDLDKHRSLDVDFDVTKASDYIVLPDIGEEIDAIADLEGIKQFLKKERGLL